MKPSVARTTKTVLLVLLLGMTAPARPAAAASSAVIVVLTPATTPGSEASRVDAAARQLLAARGVTVAEPVQVLAWATERGWAGPPAPPPRALVDETLAQLEAARELFFSLSLESAAEEYASAFRILDAHPEWLAESGDIRARVFDHGLRYARLLARMGLDEQADAMIRDVAGRWPEAHPDIVEHPPDFIERFLAVREAVRAKSSSLSVEVLWLSETPAASTHASCQVYVDGVPMGEAGTTEATVPTGLRRVQVACGHEWSSVHRVRVAAPSTRLAIAPQVDLRFAITQSGVVRLDSGGLALGQETERQTLARALASHLGLSAVALAPGEAEAASLYVVREGDVVAKDLALMAVAHEPEGPTSLRPWAWGTLGTGLGLFAAGGYFHWAARDDTFRINDGEDRLAARSRNITLMAVFYAAGSAALVSSAVLFLLEPESVSEKAEGGGVLVSPAPGGVSITGTF